MGAHGSRPAELSAQIRSGARASVRPGRPRCRAPGAAHGGSRCSSAWPPRRSGPRDRGDARMSRGAERRQCGTRGAPRPRRAHVRARFLPSAFAELHFRILQRERSTWRDARERASEAGAAAAGAVGRWTRGRDPHAERAARLRSGQAAIAATARAADRRPSAIGASERRATPSAGRRGAGAPGRHELAASGARALDRTIGETETAARPRSRLRR